MPQLNFKRQEIKYRLDEGQRARLEFVMGRYMDADEHGPSTVRNVYYDTPSHLIVRRSTEKPTYKEKLRIRSYTDVTDETPVFLELKKKVRGIVYKRRVVLPLGEAQATLDGSRAPQGQIEREIAFSAGRYEGLYPAMYLAYDREAFFARDDHEFRITFDRNVRCRWSDVTLEGSTEGIQLLGEGESLMEIKGVGAMPLWLAYFLDAERLRKASFSKYGAAWARQLELEARRARHLAGGPARPGVGERRVPQAGLPAWGEVGALPLAASVGAERAVRFAS